MRTGKFRPDIDEHHPTVKPDLIVDNLSAMVDVILQKKELTEALQSCLSKIKI